MPFRKNKRFVRRPVNDYVRILSTNTQVHLRENIFSNYHSNYTCVTECASCKRAQESSGVRLRRYRVPTGSRGSMRGAQRPPPLDLMRWPFVFIYLNILGLFGFRVGRGPSAKVAYPQKWPTRNNGQSESIVMAFFSTQVCNLERGKKAKLSRWPFFFLK